MFHCHLMILKNYKKFYIFKLIIYFCKIYLREKTVGWPVLEWLTNAPSTEPMRNGRSNISSTPWGASDENSAVVLLLSVFGPTVIFECVSVLVAEVDRLGVSPSGLATKKM